MAAAKKKKVAAPKKKAAPRKVAAPTKKAAAPKAKAKPAPKAKAKAKAKPAPRKKPAARKPRKTTLHRDKLIPPPEPLVERNRTRLLRDGERFGSATIALHTIADLELPTGEIVTCDPFLVDGDPLIRKVAPGTYPVTLAVATFGDDQRVAAAIVRFRDGTPVRWEVANLAGTPRKKGTDPGYPVDALTGSFMDTATQALIKAEPGGWPTPSFKALEKQLLTDNYRHSWGWANYQPDPASRANCVAFSSGWGDGVYSSYWGLDEAGEPLCLLTDLDVFTDEDWST